MLDGLDGLNVYLKSDEMPIKTVNRNFIIFPKALIIEQKNGERTTIPLSRVILTLSGLKFFGKDGRTLELSSSEFNTLLKQLLRFPPNERPKMFWEGKILVFLENFDPKNLWEKVKRCGAVKQRVYEIVMVDNLTYKYPSVDGYRTTTVNSFIFSSSYKKIPRLEKLGVVRFEEEAEGDKLFVGVDKEAKEILYRTYVGFLRLTDIPKSVKNYKQLKAWLLAKKLTTFGGR